MATDDPNGKRPRLLSLGDGPTIQDKSELMLEELRAELRRECFVLHRGLQDANGAIRIHQETLVALVPVVHDLERASWPGRIRRLAAWWVQKTAWLFEPDEDLTRGLKP